MQWGTRIEITLLLSILICFTGDYPTELVDRDSEIYQHSFHYLVITKEINLVSF